MTKHHLLFILLPLLLIGAFIAPIKANATDLTAAEMENASPISIAESIIEHYNLDPDNVSYMYSQDFNSWYSVLKPYYMVVVFDNRGSDISFTTGNNNGTPAPDTLYSYDITGCSCPFYYVTWSSTVSYHSSVLHNNIYSSDVTFYSNLTNRQIVNNQNIYTYTNPVVWYTNFDSTNVIRNDYFVTFDYFSPVDDNSDVLDSSNLGLFADMYTISFRPSSHNFQNADVNNPVQNSIKEIGDKYIGNRYDCYLTKVKSDNGYTMLSLQCPALPTNEPLLSFYGTFTFALAHSSNHYTFDGLNISFATDVPLFDDDLSYYVPDSDFFELNVVGSETEFRPLSMTVNSISLFNPLGTSYTYKNHVLTCFDYSSDSQTYPVFNFTGCCNAYSFSAGSFIYNFSFDDVLKDGVSLSSDDLDDMGKSGKEKNDKTKADNPYVPRLAHFSNLDDGFTFDDRGDYDFTAVSDLLSWFFRNSFILDLIMACCVVGLIGYVLYGKR